MRNGFVEGNGGTHPGSLANSVKADLGATRKTVDPAVKAWLTNVLIPAMVQKYLSASDPRENGRLSAAEERLQ